MAGTVTGWSKKGADSAPEAKSDAMGRYVRVMPRIARSQLDDGYFHLTARGSTGTAIFVDDLDRLDFLDLLRSTAELCGWRGHLFGDRFSSYVLRDERHLAAAIEYILQNPVRAGLCDQARDWRWSGAAVLR